MRCSVISSTEVSKARPGIGLDPTISGEIVPPSPERDVAGTRVQGVRGLLHQALRGICPPVRRGPEIGLTGRAPSMVTRPFVACRPLSVLQR